MKKHKLGKHGICCEMIALAVDKNYGRRGIGGILTKMLKENAEKQGYFRAFAECTSAFSTRALEKFGAKTTYSIPYATWTSKKGTKPFEQA